MKLKYLTDKQLLLDTKNIAHEDRKVTAKLLHHLKEVDNRKLYSELGYSSLFKYVVQELGYSEGAAGRRVNSARMLKEIPELEEKIEKGDLNLSHISKASQKFKNDDIKDKTFKREVLKTLENTSSKECEKVLSEIVSPTSLPLMPVYHVTTLLVNQMNYQKYEDIRGILAHQKLSKDEILGKILDYALEKLREKKFKTSASRIKSTANSRYLTASIKRAVYLRDKKCRKCGSGFALEFDHIKPYALGGKTEVENLRLLCRNCNQRSRITAKLSPQGMY